MSLSEMYKAAKTTAVYIDRMVEMYAMNFERMNNVLTWADPTTTLAALTVMLLLAASISYAMKVFSPALCFFIGGLTLFYPEDVHKQFMQWLRSWRYYFGEKPEEVVKEEVFISKVSILSVFWGMCKGRVLRPSWYDHV